MYGWSKDMVLSRQAFDKMPDNLRLVAFFLGGPAMPFIGGMAMLFLAASMPYVWVGGQAAAAGVAGARLAKRKIGEWRGGGKERKEFEAVMERVREGLPPKIEVPKEILREFERDMPLITAHLDRAVAKVLPDAHISPNSPMYDLF